MGDRFLPMVAPFDYVNPAGESEFGNLSLDAFHLRLADSNADGGYPFHRSEGAEGMNEDGNSTEIEKLFRLWPRHPGAQPRSGQYHEYLHNWWSIHAGLGGAEFEPRAGSGGEGIMILMCLRCRSRWIHLC